MSDSTINEFPSHAEIEQHIENQSKPKRPKLNWTHWVIFALLGCIVLLLVGKLSQGSQVALLSGTGSVSGTVINRQSTPVAADVFVLSSEIVGVADQNGAFLLDRVPVGKRRIIIAYDGIGHEYPITVEAGKTIDLGRVQVETTEVAPVPQESKP